MELPPKFSQNKPSQNNYSLIDSRPFTPQFIFAVLTTTHSPQLQNVPFKFRQAFPGPIKPHPLHQATMWTKWSWKSRRTKLLYRQRQRCQAPGSRKSCLQCDFTRLKPVKLHLFKGSKKDSTCRIPLLKDKQCNCFKRQSTPEMMIKKESMMICSHANYISF